MRKFFYCELYSLVEPWANDDSRSIISRAYIDVVLIALEKYDHNFLQLRTRESLIVAQMEQDHELVVASIFSIFQERDLSFNKIEKDYGKSIANLVQGYRKIRILDRKKIEFPHLFLRLLTSSIKDNRSIIIRIAYCRHLIKYIKDYPSVEVDHACYAMISFYSYVLTRSGWRNIGTELQNKAFQHIYPVRNRIISSRVQSEINVNKNYKLILAILQKHVSKYISNPYYQLEGRVKQSYSIYRKMVSNQCKFKDIADIYAYRIFLETEDECYLMLGHIHALFKPIPRMIKDYIANPKANSYQALHTVVLGPRNKLLEVQIKTLKMRFHSLYGPSNHEDYKGNNLKTWKQYEKMQLQKHGASFSSSFLERTFYDSKKDANYIYVMSANSKVIRMLKGSRVLDFAYKVHTSAARKTLYALINDRKRMLDYKLKGGDVVEIFFADNDAADEEWLNMATSHKALKDINKLFPFAPANEAICSNISYSLCMKCLPVIGDQAWSDAMKVVHLKGCSQSRSLHLFNWDNIEHQSSYRANIFLLVNEFSSSITSSAMRFCASEEIHLTNIMIENKTILLNVHAPNYKVINQLVKNLMSIPQVKAVSRVKP